MAFFLKLLFHFENLVFINILILDDNLQIKIYDQRVICRIKKPPDYYIFEIQSIKK